jgi:hypothetical protein
MNSKLRYRLYKFLKGVAVIAIFLLVYQFIILPRLLSLGATGKEISRSYPGDERIKSSGYSNTLAVTVNATPSKIWPWIAQMGLNKGGFYSYTSLENLFGCDLKNADELHDAWQHPKVGDIEPVCKSQEGKPGSGWQVGIVEERKALVWYGLNDTEWMMGIYIDSIDAHRSRLITRQAFKYPAKWTQQWILEKLWFEWAHCIMQYGMIKGIEKRVETHGNPENLVIYEPHLY